MKENDLVMGRRIIAAEEMQQHKDIIKPTYFNFKTAYNQEGKKRNGIMSNKIINDLMIKAKGSNLSAIEDEVIEGFFDCLMFALIEDADSRNTFLKFEFIFGWA